jgi:acyl-CoA synthetase (AMP-forming)/AMP-acid ligase II
VITHHLFATFTPAFQYVSDAKVQYKWLKGGVEFIDAIPKNPSGKLLRRVLREKARADRAAGEKAKATL